MSLTSKQKKYIRKNAKFFSTEILAHNLDVEQKNINDYLRKIWRPEKYKKHASADGVNRSQNLNQQEPNLFPNFDFGLFFQKNLFIFIGLLFLIFIAYSNSLENDFVSDDIPAFINNPALENASAIFQNGLIGSPENLVFFLGRKLGDLRPGFFRIFNISFHVGSTFLVFFISSVLLRKRIAFLATALFAVHPIATESVAWISGIPYSLSSFLILLSLAGYILRKNIFWPLFFFFLALLTLEKTLVFPFILFLYEISSGGMQKIKKNWKRIALFFSLSFLWIILYLSKLGNRISAVEAANYQQTQEKLYNPFFQIPIAIGNYLKLIFWPDKLTLYHTEMTFNTGQYLLYLLSFLIFLAILFWGWKKNRKVFFWLSFFFVSLLPTLTPLKISWIVAERYVYLGSIGIFICLAMLFDWIFEKIKERNAWCRRVAIAFFAMIILALSTRTIIRNMDWKNEDTLWIATAKVSPSGKNIHNNLGDVYARQKNFEKAIEEFKKAIEINPRYADAYHNLGNVYHNMGKNDLARENYQKAIEFNPNLWRSYQNLAVILFDQGDYQKSLELIQKALEIDPQNKNLQENLQVIRLKIQ